MKSKPDNEHRYRANTKSGVKWLSQPEVEELMDAVFDIRKNKRVLVTFDAYLRAKAGLMMNEEQCEAFGRDVCGILTQLVFDNTFSVDAKRSFPRVKGDYTTRNLLVWIGDVHAWHDTLSRKERRLLGSLKFIP